MSAQMQAAAAAAAAKASASKRQRDHSSSPLSPAHLLALPSQSITVKREVLYPKTGGDRVEAAALPKQQIGRFADTDAQQRIHHPYHPHQLTQFRIIDPEFRTTCDLCGRLCSSDEKPDEGVLRPSISLTPPRKTTSCN